MEEGGGGGGAEGRIYLHNYSLTVCSTKMSKKPRPSIFPHLIFPNIFLDFFFIYGYVIFYGAIDNLLSYWKYEV